MDKRELLHLLQLQELMARVVTLAVGEADDKVIAEQLCRVSDGSALIADTLMSAPDEGRWNTLAGRVLTVLIDEERATGCAYDMRVSEITMRVNTRLVNCLQVKARKVGELIRNELGLKTVRKMDGYHVIWSNEQMDRLRVRFDFDQPLSGMLGLPR